MWFKSIHICSFKKNIPYKPELLETQCQGHRFRPCSAVAPVTAGFVPPVGDGDEAPLVYAAQGYMVVCVQIQEKVLPPAVLREQHQLKIKELEAKMGQRVRREERLRIKDELEHTLLGKAFAKSTRVMAYFDTARSCLLVDTSSQRKIEMIYKVLNDVILEYQPEALSLRSPSAVLTQWLTAQSYPDSFSILDRCSMQDSEEKKGKVSLSRKDLFGDSVQRLLDEGCFVTQLRLNWADKLNFTLKDDFSISGLQFSSEVKDLAKDGMPESDEDRFAADFFIMAETMAQFLQDLLPLFLDNENKGAERAKEQESVAA